MKLSLAVSLILLFGGGPILVFGLWAHDVWKDRQHKVVVHSQTPLFAGEGSDLCEGERLRILGEGESPHVRRIRYWKNCATIDVGLPNGQKGFLIFGEGSFSVNPPLP